MSLVAPKITIITINFNNAAGLKKTLQSVVNQTYKNIEYIVVDGASSDGSKELIEMFKNEIAIAIVEPDTGIYNAMNKGIKAASGDYLLFLNSGDWLTSDIIIQEAISKKLDKDIVYGDLLFFDSEKEWVWNLPSQLTFQTFFTSTIAHPSAFIKRKLFEVVGMYDETLKIVSDWKFFITAITKYNCSYKHIHLVVSAYGFDGISSLPENLPAINLERDKVLLEEFPLFINDYKELSVLKSELKKVKGIIKIHKVIRKFLGKGEK